MTKVDSKLLSFVFKDKKVATIIYECKVGSYIVIIFHHQRKSRSFFLLRESNYLEVKRQSVQSVCEVGALNVVRVFSNQKIIHKKSTSQRTLN